MTRRTGTADLPLHGGRVPKWLADRMTRLGAVISEAIVHHCGRDELLRRLAHPFWFQSFGAVMGMDWHSSGITTSVMRRAFACRSPRNGRIHEFVQNLLLRSRRSAGDLPSEHARAANPPID